jgi:hypothetical protein
MSIFIERDPDQNKAAWAFFSRADLQQIALVSSAAMRVRDWSALKQPLRTDVHFEPASVHLTENLARFKTEFAFTAVDSSSPAADAIKISCEFEASYALNNGYKPSPGEVEAFQEGNAIVNCWPFFREFVQSTVVRMNLPAPPIPFLLLAPKRNTSGVVVSEPKAGAVEGQLSARGSKGRAMASKRK